MLSNYLNGPYWSNTNNISDNMLHNNEIFNQLRNANSSDTADVQSSDLDSILNNGSNGLTAEGLLLYLQTRMQNLDGQVNGIFAKMQNVEKLRKLLMHVQNELNKLNDDQSDKDLCESSSFEHNINEAIDNISQIDPQLGERLRTMLNEEGHILWIQDGKYLTAEVNNSRELINNITKQIESGAQMDMIRLQSIMSARGTFIQMTSNLIAGLNEPMKTVVGNMR